MLAMQIDEPDDLTRHGALACPAGCTRIHGRCMDAVYPFTKMARMTGEEKYLTAAIRVMDWAENNVSQADGSWTVVPNPKTWWGISVFGAIALAETIHHHGDILPPKVLASWTERLRKVGDLIHKRFDLTFTNINYGFTGLQCLHLLGEVLNDPKYTERSHELAKGAKAFFTRPNALLFGEGKPSDSLSAKGLHPVDLGYNVEESLNGVVVYALRAGDEELLQLLEKSLAGHLEFMLPDGGWDNSWGTRQYKWCYWGSRTTDGSQLAYALMADRNPAFATAAIRTTELLQRCTAENGLIYGGLHFGEHDLAPCIHHTFAHAKPLAALLDLADELPYLDDNTPLPRAVAKGVQHFPEVDVWLLAQGPWRATVSTYDFVYKKHCYQGIGGAMTMLYHQQVGPILAASMANYKMVEKFNQQPDPDGEDYALTPRIERWIGDKWYTNLFDLEAQVSTTDENEMIMVTADVQLVDKDQQSASTAKDGFQLTYEVSAESIIIRARPQDSEQVEEARLTIPIISAATERYEIISDRKIEIYKAGGTLTIESSQPIRLAPMKRERVFNMVPGVQALPLVLAAGRDEVSCTITVKPA